MQWQLLRQQFLFQLPLPTAETKASPRTANAAVMLLVFAENEPVTVIANESR